ncbi:MAG: DUF3857 domain-containing protein [Myxococcales bacterium]|nr:DUF3857 domain-containing protein [Myxococcales bacterium]MCB9705703.1 DUF3857 domain-containing protein [Myxococcales bacterium]
MPRRPPRWLLAALLALGPSLLAGAPALAAPPSAGQGQPQGPIWRPGVRDPAAGLVGRWERELQRRQLLLKTRRGPAAALGLVGILGDLAGEIEPERLRRVIAEVAEARRHDPLVRAQAIYLLGRLAEAEGDRVGARARFESVGFLLDWEILGPFDNQGRAGHDRVYEPEQAPFDPRQSFSGKLAGESLAWQRLAYDEIPHGAYVALDDRLHPNTQATGYATIWVRVPKATTAALHLGSAGPYKVWVNGEEIGEGRVYRVANPLQESHGVRLRAGINRILVKISCDDGPWGFYARLSEPSGGPLAGLEVLPAPPSEGADPQAVAGKEPTIRSLRGLLRAAAERPKAKAQERLDLVEFERWIHPYTAGDRAPVEAARAADAAAGSARSALFLALAEPDPGESRAALLRGIERAQAEGEGARTILARMLVDLAWRDRALGLDRRFRAQIERAREVAPDDPEIEVIAAAALADDGFPLTTLAWIDDILRRYPTSMTIRREKAERLMDLGRTRESLKIFEDLRRGPASDVGVARRMIEAHVLLGEVEAARAIARERVRAAPGLPLAHRDLARLEEAAGDLEAAAASLIEAARLAPQDADTHAALGRLLARAGDTPGALRSLRRSLDLRPQQPDLRDLVATLEPSAGDDLFARYAVDLEKIAQAKPSKHWKGKSAAILHRRIAVRVLPNGLSERLDHRIIKILDDRGVRSQAVQGVAYDPDESYVDIRRARVRRADGSIAEIGAASVESLTESGYRMYYDRRIQRVDLAGLKVGDVIEVAFVTRDVAARNKFDDYFGDLVPIDGVEPQRYVDVVYEAPASRPLHFNRTVKQKASADGSMITYRFTARDRPGIRPEANMPGLTEIADYLHVSTYADWDAVGRWYWALVDEQLVVDAKIKAAVAEVLSKLPAGASEADKVAAIYRHVIESTRYVGLEFGIHGYKPYRTTDVYDRRFGDCKDKASLLKVMLGEAGITSYLTLVRTRDQGTIGATPASLAAFNHAIVYVPSLDLYLDGTAEFSGPSELPFGDQGATVLVVRDREGAELRTIPVSTPAENLQVTAQKITLAADGSATIDQELSLRGASAAGWRSSLQSAERRRERLTNVWGRYYPGVELKSLEVPGIDDVLQPVAIRARLKVPELAQAQGDRLRLPVLGYRGAVVRTMAPQAKREHDLILTSPAIEEHTIELTIPPGYTFAHAPTPAHLETPYGRFDLEVEVRGERARVRYLVEYSVGRIKASEYAAFRELLRAIDASIEGTFEIARKR